MIASDNDHQDIVRVLLEKGSNVNAKDNAVRTMMIVVMAIMVMLMVIVKIKDMVMLMIIVKIKDTYHHSTFHGHHSVSMLLLLI